MKLIKIFFSLMLIFAMTLSCKSDKKDAAKDAAEEVATESEAATTETEEATSEGAEATSEEATEAIDNADEAGEEAAEEVTEATADKKITVVYPKDTKLQNQVKASLTEFAKSNPKVEAHLHTAYAFAFYPKITKGGLGIGGAGGKGLVFDNRTVVGESRLAQATFGLQAGGQQYMEIILFEDQAAFQRFTAGKVKFSGQASAVALKDGASADINYQDGVAVFTKTIGGLMAEASVGGQSFKYKPGIN